MFQIKLNTFLTNLIRTADLNSGKSYRCRNCSQRVQEKGRAGFNILYKKYQNNSKKYGEFEIDEDTFKKLTSSNCHYCGVEPEKVCKVPDNRVSKSTSIHGEYIYNGIDRVDSNKSYTIENVVPCCEICNKAKRDMPYEDFIKYIKRLVKYNS